MGNKRPSWHHRENQIWLHKARLPRANTTNAVSKREEGKKLTSQPSGPGINIFLHFHSLFETSQYIPEREQKWLWIIPLHPFYRDHNYNLKYNFTHWRDCANWFGFKICVLWKLQHSDSPNTHDCQWLLLLRANTPFGPI